MHQERGALDHPVVTSVRAAADALRAAAQGPVWQCGDDDVEDALTLLDRTEALTCAVRASLLREADDRSMKDRSRAPSTERWLSDRFRWSRAAATSRLRQARELHRHPVVNEALAAAKLTVEQSTVATTALAQIATLDGVTPHEQALAGAFLVAQSAALEPTDLARTGQALLEKLTRAPSVDDPADADAVRRDQQRAEADAQAAERNGLTFMRRPGGRSRGRFDLGPAGTAVLLAWFRQADQPAKGDDGFEDLRLLDERRGDTLVDLLAAACCASPGATPGDPDAGDDVLLTECARGCTGTGPDTAVAGPGAIAPVALLTVTVTLAELRSGLAGAGVLDTGAAVSAATLRQLACDALVVPAVMGSPSQVLDLGRASRTWALAQRRAVWLRDRLCSAPSCDRPPQACQVHHEWEWEDGGPTDVDNGALLCGFHHRMVHRQGWTVRLAANGWPEFVPPKSIDPDQRPRQHHRYALQLLTVRSRT